MFRERYVDYQQLYQDAASNASLKDRVIALQNELSLIIGGNLNDPDVTGYLASVESADSNPKMITDTLPHLDEAVRNTLKLRRAAVEAAEMFREQTKAVMMFGSGSWGSYYSVKESSDLDLELIVHDFNDDIVKADILEGRREELLNGLRIARERDVDMVLHRFEYKGMDTMLHFITEKRFIRLMSLPVSTLPDGRYGFTEIRNYHRGAEYLDLTDRCSFTDGRRSWVAEHEELSGGWHWLNMPFCQVEDGVMYNGIFTEWHQTPSVIVGGDEYWLKGQINQLLTQFVLRMKNEGGESLRFSNILERKHRMPSHILNAVDEKAEKILANLKN